MKTARLSASISPLHIALGVSILVHAVVLTTRFVAPERFQRIFEDTPLEVILVNASASEPPEKAQAIAQKSLAGGGNADSGRATSPMPYSVKMVAGDDYEDSQRKIEAMQAQQMQLLSQLRQQISSLQPAHVQSSNNKQLLIEQEERRKQLVKLLAEIEKRINEENARPKKRFISPATREAVYAVYYDSLRRKVEDKGTQQFPEHSGRKLYGELTMILTVNHDGRLIETEIVQSSGIPLLDRRAEAIARAAGPFGSFNKAMRAQADQIAVVSRFKFTRDQTLETSVQ